MSLPPGFLDELRTRVSLSDVVGRKVTWDRRKSNQGKGDWWAPCPFHHEKTASFHVDDPKGFYYCFGCQAKGDAIGFVKETENVSFMEAVEILAGEAGLQMPARDPRAAEKAEARDHLAEAMEAAIGFFRLQLKTAAGADARAYLERRALRPETVERFELGFAPAGWEHLREHLRAKGISDDTMLAAGLVRASDKGRAPYDAFRNRIMFPIRDGRGRAIAFGGRAMDPADKAKYLNSSDTELFDKSRTLYNLRAARAAAGKDATLIVAEGYMDVIALAQAGFEAAVAPLGTAVTTDQLQMMWRIADEPVIALDGDRAGLRAAEKVVDLALPLLVAGKSLRFALMPEGKDPDDLIRAGGPDAVTQVLEAARPMVDVLWTRETAGRSFDSPERRAALDKALRDRIATIGDPGVRFHYEKAVKDRLWQLFRPARKPFAKAAPAQVRPSESGLRSALAGGGDAAEVRMREQAVLAALLSTPEIAAEFEPRLERVFWHDDLHARFCAAILASIGNEAETRSAVAAAIGEAALETLLAAGHITILPCARHPGDADIARRAVAEELAKLEAEQGWSAELDEAAALAADWTDADEPLTHRLGDAARARHGAGKMTDEDDADYEIAPNGAQIHRAERDALDALLSRISFHKRNGRN